MAEGFKPRDHLIAKCAFYTSSIQMDYKYIYIKTYVLQTYCCNAIRDVIFTSRTEQFTLGEKKFTEWTRGCGLFCLGGIGSPVREDHVTCLLLHRRGLRLEKLPSACTPAQGGGRGSEGLKCRVIQATCGGWSLQHSK